MALDVALPLPIDHLFSYLPPEGEPPGQTGTRVLVPFGNRTLTGIVIDPHSRPKNTKGLKRAFEFLDDEPVFDEELLRVTRWIADYYVTSWGLTLKAAMPAGTWLESRAVYRLKTDFDAAATSSDRDEIVRLLDESGELTFEQISRRSDTPNLGSNLRSLLREGVVERDQSLDRQPVGVKTRKMLALGHEPAEDDDAESSLGIRQEAILQTLRRHREAGNHEVSRAAVLKEANAAASSLPGLLRAGLVTEFEREVIRTPFGPVAAGPARPVSHELTAAQENAVEQISAASVGTSLLFGVTGSGKTEVYIRVIKPLIENGKSAIVLVPEISLTPQTVARFRSHFEDRVAVLHSRMSKGERFDAWRLINEGRRTLVIGPRSAVLAPVKNLGLIVVDEEHEPSYKQFEPAPRYHARDVAVMRAHMSGAACVLGSATPSLESFQNARRGKYRLLRLDERVPNRTGQPARMPEVTRVDLTVERGKKQLPGLLSNPLRTAIEERLKRGEQTIVLQNRRGYAPVLECQACGWHPECRDCAVTLTYHQRRRHLRCHYCGLAKRVPSSCPSCGGSNFTRLGAGTQRVEEELERLFPEASIERMDFDTTTTKNAHFKILKRFADADVDVLVGTQMVAKGLDFPNVTLVGIVDADTRLLLPDFRAAEHTFHLLAQVAGRSGRGDLRGEVILQTRNVRHEVIRRACRHDFEGFATDELKERMALGYPPYGRLVSVEFKSTDEAKAELLARESTARILHKLPRGVRVLGPEQALISKIKQFYRYRTLLKLSHEADHSAVRRVLREMLDGPGGGSSSRIIVDVDPIGLL